MKSVWIVALGMLAFASGGCHTVHQPNPVMFGSNRNASLKSSLKSQAAKHDKQEFQTDPQDSDLIRQVDYQEDRKSKDDLYIQPGGNDERETERESIAIIREAPFSFENGTSIPQASTVGSTTLEQIEQTALATNPAVAEILAEIQSLRGKLTQSGLPPNPTLGINGDDINEDGGAGRYGVYFGRQIVRGNKLGLSRSVVCAEIKAAEQRLAVVQQRLLTDVRQRYYELLVAQETVEITKNLVTISQNAVDVSQKLFEAKEAAKISVLQSELELKNVEVTQRQAANQQLAARRKLAALLGEADLALSRVEGNPRHLLELDDFEQSYDQIVNSSPEIAALFADVEQRRRELARACVEPIPNLTWQTTLQYDTVSDDVIAGFQVGMPIPTLNQNQGAICQARHQIVAAERRAEKKALDLRQRLAIAYEAWLDGKLQVDAYESEIIPKAKETLELVTKGYEQGEIDYLQLLTAQRTWSQLNLTYLRQLQQVWRQNVQINGLLLSGSLD